MEFPELLKPGAILPNLRVDSKKEALQALSTSAADLTGIGPRKIFDVLLERERLGTTGVGNGVAIPHGKLREIKEICGIFAKLEHPINFEAVDEEPVDLIFLLLAPDTIGTAHLKALAHVSRLLRDASFCDKIRALTDPNTIFKLMKGEITSTAA